MKVRDVAKFEKSGFTDYLTPTTLPIADSSLNASVVAAYPQTQHPLTHRAAMKQRQCCLFFTAKLRFTLAADEGYTPPFDNRWPGRLHERLRGLFFCLSTIGCFGTGQQAPKVVIAPT